MLGNKHVPHNVIKNNRRQARVEMERARKAAYETYLEKADTPEARKAVCLQ